jgi:iron complex outermembrane recepter protein
LTLATSVLTLPGAAMAQRTGENAVTSADDAFGSSVGLESTGIYTEFDTRGFSPSRAGNARIDGIYYDPVGGLSARLRQGNAIRVGFAAEEYPFQAPTGIVEYRFKPFPKDDGTSFGYNFMAFGGFIREWDVRLLSRNEKLAFLGGGAQSDLRQSDGASNEAWGFTGRVVARLGSVEVSPFASIAYFTQESNHPIAVVSGDTLPGKPKLRQYLGQKWASGYRNNHQMGVMAKGALTDSLSFRAGLFHADSGRRENYSEIFSLQPEPEPGTNEFTARHRLLADPEHALHSTSGEAQLAWRMGTGDWQHRLIAGFRARDRVTHTGGSDVRDFGTVRFGDPNPRDQPQFAFRSPNRGRVKQSSFMLGYVGKFADVATLNLGLQKARYRGTFIDAGRDVTTTSRDDPWLYNATLGVHLTPSLSLYAGTQKGLEDSGAAPDNALNRNEQLPPTRVTQYEGGLRWKFPHGQAVVNAFLIEKPYFTFLDDGNSATQDPFIQTGQVRHRGVEASLSGQFGKRLNLLAGVVALQPRVAGGLRPAGTPSLFARIDANYRTDILGGLTPTASFSYIGSRALSSKPFDSLEGKQLEVPGYVTLDLGLRQQFHIGKVPMSFRMLVWNVFDAKTWKVVAANTIYMDERRRLNLTIAADF